MSKPRKFLVSKRWIREMIKAQRADLFVGAEFIETVQLNLDPFIRHIVALKHKVVPIASRLECKPETKQVDKRSAERIKSYMSEHPHINDLDTILTIVCLQLHSWLEACEMVMLHADRKTLMQKDITLILALFEVARVYRISHV